MDLGICCCLGSLAWFVLGLGAMMIASQLYDIRKNRARQEVLDEALQSLGFAPLPGSPWRLGVVDGVEVAAKLMPGVSLGDMGVQGDTRLFVTAIAMLAVDLPLLGGRISREGTAKPAVGKGFDDLFFGEVGGDVGRLSAEAKDVLTAWSIEHPEDDLGLCDRDNKWSYAGLALPRAEVVLRVERSKGLSSEALADWLAHVVAQSAPLRSGA